MKTDWMRINDSYDTYLTDESGLTGTAEYIAFPESEDDILRLYKEIPDSSITIQGARTGLGGGAVPDGGAVLNLSHMNQVLSCFRCEDGSAVLTAQSGLTISELEEAVRSLLPDGSYFWPPAPSEKSASIGGSAASDAAGIFADHYGSMCQYIHALHYIDRTGSVIRVTDPDIIKRIIGSEGSFGPITQLSLRLLPVPEHTWGLVFFFEKEADAISCADKIRSVRIRSKSMDDTLTVLEFMDRTSILLANERRSFDSSFPAVPEIPSKADALIYAELSGSEEDIEELAGSMLSIIEEYEQDPDMTWSAEGLHEVNMLRGFRHAVGLTLTEQVRRNQTEYPDTVLLDTDFCPAFTTLSSAMHYYRKDLAAWNQPAAVFGHVLSLRLRVIILPTDEIRMRKGAELLTKWYQFADRQADTVLYEQGTGTSGYKIRYRKGQLVSSET